MTLFVHMNKYVNKKASAFLPPIDSFSSRKEWETACWQKLLKSEELLKTLTTSYERHNIVMRAAVSDGFIAGKSYRRISKETQLSLQTIGVIKKAIRERNYRSYLERSKKERKKRKYSAYSVSAKRRLIGTPRRAKHGTICLSY